MHISAVAGHQAGIYQAIEQLQAVHRRYDLEMLPQTEETITALLEAPSHAS